MLRVFKCSQLLLVVFLFFIFLSTHAQSGADSIKEALKHNNIGAARRMELLNELSVLFSADSTSQSLLFANEAYLLALKEGNKLMQARSLINLAEGYLYNDNYDQALQYAFNALDVCLKENSKPDIAACYTSLGWIFFDTENAEFSMQYHQLASRLLKETGETKKWGVSFNAIGLVYHMKGEIDSASVYFQNALQVAKQTGNTTGEAAALNNIGICENVRGRYNDALGFFNQSLVTKVAKNAMMMQAETLNQMSDTYLRLKKYPEAEALLKRARGLIDSSTSNARKEKLLDNLYLSSQLYEAQKKYTEAFSSLEEYTQVRNEILSRSKSDAIAALKLKRETAENAEQIRVLDAQKELRAFQRNALGVGLILLLIIGMLLYKRMKQRQKKEQELAAVKEQLMKKDLENSMLEKEALNSKLEYKNAELKNSALYLSQRNELIREFTDELAILKKDVQKEGQDKFNRFLNKFLHDLEINKEGQQFNLTADELHKDFIYNLLQLYPDLTENERRLCTQIRLNLSIKDIASINNISVKSAEMARYRLRKHFNLQHEESLNDFLNKF